MSEHACELVFVPALDHDAIAIITVTLLEPIPADVRVVAAAADGDCVTIWFERSTATAAAAAVEVTRFSGRSAILPLNVAFPPGDPT